MGKKPFIDKKTARHFHLVNKPLSENDSSLVLDEIYKPTQQGIIDDKPLFDSDEEKAGPDCNKDDDIGEAVKYGIYFTDQHEYDYMQHLKEIGTGGMAVWIESAANKKNSTKNVKEVKIVEGHGDEGAELDDNKCDENVEPGVEENEDKFIEAGLKKEHEEIEDPAIREVLEALEDEAYVVEDDEFMNDLLNAEKEDFEDAEEFDEIKELLSFKKRQNINHNIYDGSDLSEDDGMTRFTMTSQAVPRTEHLVMLDDRFEQLMQNDYGSEEDDSKEEEEETPELATIEIKDPSEQNLIQLDKTKRHEKIFDDFLKDLDTYDNRKKMHSWNQTLHEKYETLDEIRSKLKGVTIDEEKDEDEENTADESTFYNEPRKYKTIVDKERRQLKNNSVKKAHNGPKVITVSKKKK